jgi:hypothetical protein
MTRNVCFALYRLILLSIVSSVINGAVYSVKKPTTEKTIIINKRSGQESKKVTKAHLIQFILDAFDLFLRRSFCRQLMLDSKSTAVQDIKEEKFRMRQKMEENRLQEQQRVINARVQAQK